MDMDATQIVTFAGLATLIIATQIPRRQLTLRRLLLPFAAAGLVAYHYLNGVPTVGGDLDFEMLLSAFGLGCGLLAGLLMRVERDQATGKIVTQAGVAYASLWVLIFGGRLAFAWAATNVWQHQVMQFSLQHAITSSTAWTAAFVLMAISMVVGRTIVVALRALKIDGMAGALRPAAR
jgi:hypothetical protein